MDSVIPANSGRFVSERLCERPEATQSISDDRRYSAQTCVAPNPVSFHHGALVGMLWKMCPFGNSADTCVLFNNMSFLEKYGKEYPNDLILER